MDEDTPLSLYNPLSFSLTPNCRDQTCAVLTRSGGLTNAIIRTAGVEVAGGWQLPRLLSWGPVLQALGGQQPEATAD